MVQYMYYCSNIHSSMTSRAERQSAANGHVPTVNKLLTAYHSSSHDDRSSVPLLMLISLSLIVQELWLKVSTHFTAILYNTNIGEIRL